MSAPPLLARPVDHRRRRVDRVAEIAIAASALVTVTGIVLIFVFVFREALPVLFDRDTQLEANLATRQLSGRLSPNAKNPQILSVSPSVGISGTMESPKVVLTPDSLITAPLRLIFPIHVFAFNWLRQTGVPADGSAGCRQAFERATSVRAKKPPPPSRSSPRFWPF